LAERESPPKYVEQPIKQPTTGGRLRVYLGTIPDYAEEVKGVLLSGASKGGPADKAGIKGGSSTVVVEGSTYRIGGDVIVTVNGVKVVNSDALASYLEAHAVAGQTVQLGILRSEALTTLSVTLDALPAS